MASTQCPDQQAATVGQVKVHLGYIERPCPKGKQKHLLDYKIQKLPKCNPRDRCRKYCLALQRIQYWILGNHHPQTNKNQKNLLQEWLSSPSQHQNSRRVCKIPMGILQIPMGVWQSACFSSPHWWMWLVRRHYTRQTTKLLGSIQCQSKARCISVRRTQSANTVPLPKGVTCLEVGGESVRVGWPGKGRTRRCIRWGLWWWTSGTQGG